MHMVSHARLLGQAGRYLQVVDLSRRQGLVDGPFELVEQVQIVSQLVNDLAPLAPAHTAACT